MNRINNFEKIYDRIVEELRGNLTNGEYREMICLEYVLTWEYNGENDEERYIYLVNKKYNES